jgi:predicted PurR-regulated permease PerM
MDSRRKFKWIANATIIFVALAVIYVTKAFIITIIWSLFVAYLLYPLYSYLLRITKNKQVSALMTLSLVFAIFLICFLVVLDALITEVGILESHYTIQDTANNFLIAVSGFAERYVPNASQYTEEASRQFEDFAKDAPKLLSLASGALTGIASKTVIYLAQFVAAVLLVYYLLIDGENMIDKATHLLPERGLVLKFLDELKPIYQSLFNVYLITCMLTGVIAAVGFFLLGVSYPILWGIVVAVFALLPLVGANLIYALMAIYYLAIQDYKMGVAIMIFGIIFLTVIPENIIRPRLAMKGASIHPAITLLSFAAPLFVLGAVGIVVGPALYGFLLAVYRTHIRYGEEKAEVEASAAASDGGEPVC